MCICGFVLARYRATAGGAASWRDFARLNAELFTPCLVLGAFTKGISATVLSELWPVIVLAVLLPCIWLVTGALGARLLLAKDQRHFVRFAAVCVAYPNAFAIPYPLMRVLVKSLDWPSEREDMDAYIVSVIMLFSAVLLFQVWTVAFSLYGKAAKEEAASMAAARGAADVLPKSLPAAPSDPSIEADGQEQQPKPTALDKPELAPDVEVGIGPAIAPKRSSRVLVIGSNLRAVREACNPTLVSLLLALAISVSPIREPFLKSGAHDWFSFVGAASVPMVLIQLGAGMARRPSLQGHLGDLRWHSALVVVFLRLIVANLIGSCVVTVFRRMGWIQDPYLILCMYLMCCSPTAANVSLVSSVQGAFVQPTAVTLFVMQACAVLSMTISITIYVASLS